MEKIALEEEISIRITKKEITILIKEVDKKIDNVRNEFIKKKVSVVISEWLVLKR